MRASTAINATLPHGVAAPHLQGHASTARIHKGMTMKSAHDSPILVTGAAGAVGAIGRNLTAMLLAKGHKVRALVRREDERADALRRLGA